MAENYDDAVSAYTFFPGGDVERVTEEIRVERTHWGFAPYPDLPQWAVRRIGCCFNRDGKWEYEPQPSSRDREFLERCRFSREEALRLALKILSEHPGPTEQPSDPLVQATKPSPQDTTPNA